MKASQHQRHRQWPNKAQVTRRPAREQPKAAAGVLLVLEPSTGKPARVVLGSTSGTLFDFGGKQESRDQSLWATAQRECVEESGFRPEAHHGAVDVQNKLGKPYTVFVVTIPEDTLGAALKTGSWVVEEASILAQRPENLHPRLRYAPGRATKQLLDICKKVGSAREPALIGAYTIVLEPLIQS